MKKVAFLFLIYSEFNNEELWYIFFKNIDPEKYIIKIHYKTQHTLKYFEKYKIKNCIPTNYATDTSIARAHNILIRSALEDKDVVKTINLSQACIPLKSFDHIYNFLTQDNLSHFNIMPMSDWSVTVTKPALKYLKRDEIHKAANWFILNREHAICCLEHKEYLDYFHSVLSPEEFIYITLLKKYNCANLCLTNYSAEGATTFTNWNSEWGMVYKYPVHASIKNYTTISEEELLYLLSSPCLFGRKFHPNFKVDTKPAILFEPYIEKIL